MINNRFNVIYHLLGLVKFFYYLCKNISMDITIFYEQFGENRVNSYFIARLTGDKLSYDKSIEETVIYFQKIVDGVYEDYMSKIPNQFN